MTSESDESNSLNALSVALNASGAYYDQVCIEPRLIGNEQNDPYLPFSHQFGELTMENESITNCVYNARSSHLKCAVNPTGSCDGCKDFKAIKLPEEQENFDMSDPMPDFYRAFVISAEEFALIANQTISAFRRDGAWGAQAREWPVHETMEKLSPLKIQTTGDLRELYGEALESISRRLIIQELEPSDLHNYPPCDRTPNTTNTNN